VFFVFRLFTSHLALILISIKLHQLIHEAQIYFVFLCDGKNAFGNVGWLCKLFDKALVGALACGALAMCLQMRGLFLSFYYFNLLIR
jgi:hypothetical protein